ncbi:hypothetical protein [Nocardia abscessus]|uniref:Uncharacterized protein n=1 Tax=Nocardia abscessus TaxID=120957 RepID=A0ABS0CCQ2_9NOCA|nr:hypothetical protein [Nocardia abscessus]MBF6227267.1 hypothetical protein [Nocardia abscessus]
MLTGAMPFARTTTAAVLRAHLAEPPPRPSAADPMLPAALDAARRVGSDAAISSSTEKAVSGMAKILSAR